MSIFQRITVRPASASTGHFYTGVAPAPPYPIPLSPQAGSFVVLARFLDAAASNGVLLSQWDAGSPLAGYLFGGDGASGAFLQAGDGVTNPAPVATSSRVLTAADEGRVHRLVGTVDVAGGAELVAYLNGRAGAAVAITGMVGAPGVVGRILGSAAGSACTAWDVLDVAYLGSVLTAQDVLELDREIRATGGIPSNFAAWDMLLRAESLVNKPTPPTSAGMFWNCGGRADGKVVTSVSVAPLLRSVYVADRWGTP